jgi:hypothetical protein
MIFAAVTCLPSYCSSAVWEFIQTDPETFIWYDTDRNENTYSADLLLLCSLPRQILPGRCLANKGGYVLIAAPKILPGCCLAKKKIYTQIVGQKMYLLSISDG